MAEFLFKFIFILSIFLSRFFYFFLLMGKLKLWINFLLVEDYTPWQRGWCCQYGGQKGVAVK